MLGSRLGDKHGARRILIGGITLFIKVAAVAVTAQGITQLLVAIALQGAAAGLRVPCGSPADKWPVALAATAQ